MDWWLSQKTTSQSSINAMKRGRKKKSRTRGVWTCGNVHGNGEHLMGETRRRIYRANKTGDESVKSEIEENYGWLMLRLLNRKPYGKIYEIHSVVL